MTIHEYGKEHEKLVLLIHPSVVMWDYFEQLIPLLENKCRLVIPALPGYDPDQKGDFTGIEPIAAEIEDWLIAHALSRVDCVYGCSMGGSVIMRMLAGRRLHIKAALIDGGITPYRLPWLITRLIAVKDFLTVYIGKLGGIRLLQRAFTTDEYTEEDLQYVAGVLRMMSARTIWRTFESCNNYAMPNPVRTNCREIEYLYAATEEKARKKDLAYVREHFPHARFRKMENIGHGGLAVRKPEILAECIERMLAFPDQSQTDTS
ncbi:MAG: alpha/beta hydrolase [Bacillota bacterium]|nr:alpha/beta hydrolase [Bacillota bacterium]